MPAVEYDHLREALEARAAPNPPAGPRSTAKEQPPVHRAPLSFSSTSDASDMGVSTPGTDPSGAACDWLALLGGDGEGWSAPAAAAPHADGGVGAEAQLLAARRAPKGPQLMHDSFRSLRGAAALRAAAAAGAAGAPWPDERDVAAGGDSDTPRRAEHGGDESPAKRLGGAGTPRRGDQLRRRLQQSLQPQQPQQQQQQSQLNCKMSEHAQQARHPQRLDTSGSDDLDRAGSDETGCSEDVEEGLPVPSGQQQQQEQGQQQRQRRWGPTAQERTPLLLQPPCAGRYAAGVRYHTDPAPPRLLPRVGWEVLGIASLIGYMALPLHLVIILVCAVTFSWPAVIFLTAIVGSLALPARPLMWAPFLEFALLRSIRTYFDFSFTLEDPAVLEKHVIWAEYPHGVYPLSQLLAVSLNPRQWPGFRLHTVGASVLFKVPVWKHLLGWMGVRPATRREFGSLLERGPVKVNPGGIAEMYLLRHDCECIKLLDRKGFVRLAVQHGTPLLPVYHFGLSRMLNYGPKCLELLSRRMRMSLGIILGRWGLPLPFKVKLHMVVGSPVPVRCLPRDHPDFAAAVDEAHAAYMQALGALYTRHAAAYGWGDRPLVMV